MSELVNLNKPRKTKAKQAAAGVAAENRVTFGRSKAQKAAARAEKAKSDALLDSHKRRS
jgi:hypothetical protein